MKGILEYGLWAVAGCLVAGLLGVSDLGAVEKTSPPPGIREKTPALHALTNARIVTGAGQTIEKGTIVVREGMIAAVGASVAVPGDAWVWDMTGKTVYPGFIDAYTELAATPSGRPGGGGGGETPGTPAPKSGANYWNLEVTPQARADAQFVPDADANKAFRSQGVVARVVAPAAGIIKGTSVVVTTGSGDGTAVILKDRAALHGNLRGRFDAVRSIDRQEGYPNSPMGAMALFRQAFCDADWYRQAWDAYRKGQTLPRPERNDALEALQGYSGGTTARPPVVIDASDVWYVLRADQVAKEFGLHMIVRGSGEEYQRLDAVAATKRPIIVPLSFPKAPRVKTPEEAMGVSLKDLMHWDIAPENAGRLAKAGVAIAFTSKGLKEPKEFLGAVRKAVERGLDRDAALRALTLTAAELFGVADKLGSIAVGKSASLVVTDGDLFEEKTQIQETWVDGRRYEVKARALVDSRGTWEVSIPGQSAGDTLKLTIKGEAEKPTGSLAKGGKEAKLGEVSINDARINFTVKGDSLGWAEVTRMSATLSGGALVGNGVWADGKPFTWTAARLAALAAEPDTAKPEPVEMASYPVNFPLGAFGVSAPPPQPAAVAFIGATVWTAGPLGRIDQGTVVVQNGKIAAVGGSEIAIPAGAVVVDAKGKHLSPGVIDCHSHIATDGGVNEGGQTITAEVRIGDFVDSNDLSIYRQLAGGVTGANILHGSANTIGGQNQVIKFRWGVLPEELKNRDAPPGIKFALGENVKQSNRGERFTTRYPQTRMGVEQLVRDEFTAAREYQARWEEWRRTKRGIPPRRDLELDAIAEVLDGSRLVHCHSYRQDEILALMRTCEDFGVKLATFQHVLEGYKVADVMARHGVGGSSFSDWWAFKYEGVDAIPYNGALMHNAGVLVSLNSDDAELGRRLNLEAAKAVKYGRAPEEEALKFVTINPAKQLHIDSRVGSLEAGKDADLVVWSGSPLSTLSHCEQTWVDGRKYFDRAEDQAARQKSIAMKASLIQKALRSGDEGSGGGEKKEMLPREDIYCDHGDHTLVEGR